MVGVGGGGEALESLCDRMGKGGIPWTLQVRWVQQILATLDAPEDLATDGRSVFVADGSRVLALKPHGLEEVQRCAGTITALLGR